MLPKRYAVFVSSTYTDLIEERQATMDALLRFDCFPAAMELFPAMDEEQFEFIKRVIDDCDYYILLIGGRYGSLSPNGLSYTEREYDYAVGKPMKVIALVHEDPGAIRADRVESSDDGRRKLEAFRRKVMTGRLVKTWRSKADIASIVMASLSLTIKVSPAVGWIRANKAASEELLYEVNELRKKLNAAEHELAELRAPVVFADLASGEEKVTLSGRFSTMNGGQKFKVELSWNEIFAAIAPKLSGYPHDNVVQQTLANFLFEKVNGDGYNPTLNEQDFLTVAVQLKALQLVKIELGTSVKGSANLYWTITPRGENLMYQLRAIRTVTAAP